MMTLSLYVPIRLTNKALHDQMAAYFCANATNYVQILYFSFLTINMMAWSLHIPVRL